ncbi:uroporphyrinogen-III synthase [Ramlibacter sp. AN1015]|uniref:uroporphyrinogen-III synthase n=1 Tax=Ramlibacter sp. AN1015 TaxID=3133428 RepID=UPI0030C30B3F
MDGAPPAVLVTRPARQAQQWVAALRAAGVAAEALPLIAIAAAPDLAALAQARAGLHTRHAAMFVSAHAVQGFFEGGLAWPPGVQAWATGPGTRAALLDAGVPPACIEAPEDDAPRFDSEALWQRVHADLSARSTVLLVRGADAQGRPAGRDWLAERLASAGAEVNAVAAYQRLLPSWDAAQRARACNAGGAWWIFSSSEAVRNLQALLPGHDWSQGRALATHPRIAEAAASAGFARVVEVRPGIEPLLGFLQSGA